MVGSQRSHCHNQTNSGFVDSTEGVGQKGRMSSATDRCRAGILDGHRDRQIRRLRFPRHRACDCVCARCERCLLITESPKTPGHYRYLIWVLGYIPYTGLAVFSFAISRVPVYTAILSPCEFVFSTLQSRSCWQLTNFCLLRGLKAKCYGYTSCVFVSDLKYFRGVC